MNERNGGRVRVSEIKGAGFGKQKGIRERWKEASDSLPCTLKEQPTTLISKRKSLFDPWGTCWITSGPFPN
jgi:hypothetical protein